MKNNIFLFVFAFLLIQFPANSQDNINQACVDQATEHLNKIKGLFSVFKDESLLKEIETIKEERNIALLQQFVMKDDSSIWVYLFNLNSRLEVERQIEALHGAPYMILKVVFDYEGDNFLTTKYDVDLDYELSPGLAKFDFQIKQAIDLCKTAFKSKGFNTQMVDEYKKIMASTMQEINKAFDDIMDSFANLPVLMKEALNELKKLKEKDIEEFKISMNTSFNAMKEEKEKIDNNDDDKFDLGDEWIVINLGSFDEGEMSEEEITSTMENASPEINNYFSLWEKFSYEEIAMVYMYAFILQISEIDTDEEIQLLCDELKQSATDQAIGILKMFSEGKSMKEIREALVQFLEASFKEKIMSKMNI